MELRVECHAGGKVDERPVRVQLDERPYLVEKVIDQSYGPDDTVFKVRADDHNLYILRRPTPGHEWGLESFQRLK